MGRWWRELTVAQVLFMALAGVVALIVLLVVLGIAGFLFFNVTTTSSSGPPQPTEVPAIMPSVRPTATP